MESTNMSMSAEGRAGSGGERSNTIQHRRQWPAIFCRRDVYCSCVSGRSEGDDSVDQARMPCRGQDAFSPPGERSGDLSSDRSEVPCARS